MTSKLSIESLQISKQLKDDFLYYAPRCLKIATKDGSIKPLMLNYAQSYIHSKLEEQLKTTGKIRALIVKGRQQGCSTYVEGRYLWKTTHTKGVKAFILTNNASASEAIWSMTKRYYNNLPDLVKPSLGKDSAAALDFIHMDSGYRVATAGSTAVGRGSTIQYIHGSEVAYWSNGDAHITGLLQAVPDDGATEIILESTSTGPTGVFYKMVTDSIEGKTDFQTIFIPWFWSPEYSKELPEDFVLSQEEHLYKILYDLNDKQIYWRRIKSYTFVNGLLDFQREYPATLKEAFETVTLDALWKPNDINHISHSEYENLLTQHEKLETVIGFDPAVSNKPGSDESGIVAGTLLSNDIVYITHDKTGKYDATTTIELNTDLYQVIQAQSLLVEKNNGGHFLEIGYPDSINIQLFHSILSKQQRASTASLAYKQKKVVHVGQLELLEREMTTWNPYSKSASPNRIDAMGFVVNHLLGVGAKYRQPSVWWSSFD